MKTELIKDVAKLMASSPTVQEMAVRSVEGWEDFLNFFKEEQVKDFKLILEEEAKTMLNIDHEYDRKDKKREAKFNRKVEQILFNADQKWNLE